MRQSFHKHAALRMVPSPLKRVVEKRASGPYRVRQCTQPLGDTKWLDPGHFILDRLGGVPQIDCPLGVEPELRRIPEQPRQAERHLRTHRATASQQLNGHSAAPACSNALLGNTLGDLKKKS